MAASFIGLGMLEVLVLLLGGGGVALPVGLPPGPEDPKLAQVAPAQCLLYVSWAGTADADPKSGNGTERILADPQVKFMFKRIEEEIFAAVKRELGDGAENALFAEHAPGLVKLLLTKPAAIYLSKVEFGNAGVNVEAGVVVNMGKDLAAAKKSLEVIEGLIVKEMGQPIAQWNGLRRLPFPEEEGVPPVAWGVEGDYILIAIGNETGKNLRAALANGAAPQWLKDARAKVSVPRPSMVAHIDIAAILKLIERMAGLDRNLGNFTAIVKGLGLDKIKSFTTVGGFDETGYLSRSLVATSGEPTGLLKLVGDKPLKAADLADIPADADLAIAMRFDAAGVWDEMRKVIAAVEPRAVDEFDRGIAEAEQQIGFKIKADLIDSLGDTIAFYNSPGDGGLVITGLTGVVHIKNKAKIEKVVASLEKILDKEFNWRKNDPDFNPQGRGRRPREYEFKKIEYLGQTIHMLNPIDDDAPVAPAWCITEDRFVIAAYPQMIKAYLGRAAAANKGPSVAENPHIKDALSRSPVMISYLDTPALMKKLYPVLNVLAVPLCGELQRMRINLDVSLLPTASAIVPNLRPDVGTISRTADGIMLESRQSLPTMGAAGVAPVLLFFGMAMPMVARDHAELGIARADFAQTVPARPAGDKPFDEVKPAADPPRPVARTAAAKRAIALNDLHQIFVGLFVYHTDNNKPAAALGDLEKYLGDKKMLTDPWGQAYVYHAAALKPAGKDTGKVPFASTSHLIDGKRAVVYGDGHAAMVEEKEFKKQIEDAKLKYAEPVDLKGDEKKGDEKIDEKKSGDKDSDEARPQTPRTAEPAPAPKPAPRAVPAKPGVIQKRIIGGNGAVQIEVQVQGADAEKVQVEVEVAP